MPPASEVQQANPPHLSNNTFLVNLAVTFNVVSIPLAIFIFILVLIACVLFIVAVVCIVRSCIKRKFVPKRKKKPYKSIFLEDIPGLVPSKENESLGSLEYSLEYNMDKSRLTVNVIQANNLVPRAGMDSLDPYVRLVLLKTKGDTTIPIGKFQKTTRKKSTHPNWNQLFTFDVAESDLKRCALQFEVFDYDSIGQDYSLGQLKVYLKDLDEAQYIGNVLEQTGYLGVGGSMVHGIGELCIGLSYYPQFTRIDITVFEARQLSLGKYLSSSKENHIFVEVELWNKNKRPLNSSSTKTKTDLVNPYFNERISFPLKHIQLEDCKIVCRLRRHGRITKKTLAYVEIGGSTMVSTGMKQWEEMLKGPSKTHVMWHVLVPKGGVEDE